MQLDHYNIRTNRLAETIRFYETVVGLKSGFRPQLPMAGAWLYGGELDWRRGVRQLPSARLEVAKHGN